MYEYVLLFIVSAAGFRAVEWHVMCITVLHRKAEGNFRAPVTQECETGMPLSYHKGGLTEHNVFVFWFRALVTQTCSSSSALACN